MARVLAMILAGGEGKRLFPLTLQRSKPSVPFGGKYRVIDFVLSNFINSAITQIYVLTQFKSDSLNAHISRTYSMNPKLGQFVRTIPAQMRVGREWYKGSSNAVFQNLHLILDHRPDYICVFGGDHIYKMDVRSFIDSHINSGCDLSIAAVPVPQEEAKSFGVIEINENWRMLGFEEKPENPKVFQDDPPMSLCSMGNYVFSVEPLIKALMSDSKNPDSHHDFGKNIMPHFMNKGPVNVYNFMENNIPGDGETPGYWIDIGTLENYYEASMDLVSIKPSLNLYNKMWKIQSPSYGLPPAKFVHANEEKDRVGIALDSIVCDGVIISGAKVNRSILGYNVRVNSFSSVSNSILMDDVEIGRHCQIQNAIIDKLVHIPEGSTIGFDRKEDEKKYFVSDSGIVVIPKYQGSEEHLLSTYNIDPNEI